MSHVLVPLRSLSFEFNFQFILSWYHYDKKSFLPLPFRVSLLHWTAFSISCVPPFRLSPIKFRDIWSYLVPVDARLAVFRAVHRLERDGPRPGRV